jgi:hypothetical protein
LIVTPQKNKNQLNFSSIQKVTNVERIEYPGGANVTVPRSNYFVNGEQWLNHSSHGLSLCVIKFSVRLPPKEQILANFLLVTILKYSFYLLLLHINNKIQ